MANHFSGNLADVWKHLPLVEMVSMVRPALYAETHAGNAVYDNDETAERAIGVVRFRDVAPVSDELSSSRYHRHLARFLDCDGHVLGSAALVMAELGRASNYVLCDVDPASVANFTAWAGPDGLADVTEVVRGDGMRTLADGLLSDAATVDPATALGHIDPFNPTATHPESLSALELAGALIGTGVAVVYWCGFDRPEQRAWAYDKLAASSQTTLSCGDLMVTTATGEVRFDGNLGVATTPGTMPAHPTSAWVGRSGSRWVSIQTLTSSAVKRRRLPSL